MEWVSLPWLLALAVATAAGLVAGGLAFRDAFRVTGTTLSRGDGAALGLAAHAANLTVRSGGSAGLAVVVAAARRRRLDEGRLAAGYLLVGPVKHLASTCALVLALVVLLLQDELGPLELAGAGALVGSRALRALLGWRALGSPRLAAALDRAGHRLCSMWRRLRRRPARACEGRVAGGALAARGALGELLRAPRRLLLPLRWTSLLVALHVLYLWLALRVVGVSVGPELVLVAYGTALVASAVAILPAGLGAVEVGATTALVAQGVPLGAAAAAVALSRVCDIWIPLAAGALLARRLVRVPAERRVDMPLAIMPASPAG